MQSLGGCILTFLESLVFMQFYLVRNCVKESFFYKSFTEKVMNWARPWRAGWNGERLKAENKHKVFAMAYGER